MATHRFVTVDVFTEVRFGGNPLAVVLDAAGLETAQMQRIAAEFNYSETTFVLPPDDPANTARVRIFTTTSEMPFAGHPNVGTAYVLAKEGEIFGTAIRDEVRFEEIAGLVPVAIERDGDGVVAARLTAPKSPTIGDRYDADALAPALGLASSEIRTAEHPPIVSSVGLPFVVVELTSLDALARARADAAAFDRFADHAGWAPNAFLGVYLYTRIEGEPNRVRARMFSPRDGITEDPATGSAAGALAGLLATLDPAREGTRDLVIEQGVEMGRSSRIETTATVNDGAVTKVTVAGRCVPVMRGEIEV